MKAVLVLEVRGLTQQAEVLAQELEHVSMNAQRIRATTIDVTKGAIARRSVSASWAAKRRTASGSAVEVRSRGYPDGGVAPCFICSTNSSRSRSNSSFTPAPRRTQK